MNVKKIRFIKLEKTYTIMKYYDFRFNNNQKLLTFLLFSWVEILFNPRSPVEKIVADVMRFVHPYLAFVSYRFHVEKARDAGMQIVLSQN